MPTVAKTSSTLAKLGDLSTYSVTTSATPVDTADSSGVVPNVSATFVDGTNPEFLVGESFSLNSPVVGNYAGEIIEVGTGSNSSRYSLSSETLLSRLTADRRLYPSQTYAATEYIPLAALEYWSQQCGIFYDALEGDVLFYQSKYLHSFAYIKGMTRPIRSTVPAGALDPISAAIIGDRLITSFGRGTVSPTPIISPDKLSLLVPAIGAGKTLVFTAGIHNLGTGRQSSITWNMETPTQGKHFLNLVIDNAAGVTLQARAGGAAYTNLGTVAGAVNGEFRVNIGVSEATATTTTFQLNVLSPSGTLVGSTTATVASGIRSALSVASIDYGSASTGSGTQQYHYGVGISVMNAMPVSFPAATKSLTPNTKTAEYYSGFSGNVWEHIKAYCSIYHLDVSFVSGRMTVSPRNKTITNLSGGAGAQKKISKREQAKYVEVVVLDSKSSAVNGFSTPILMWAADSVYQVNVGETQEFLVQTDHSILTLSQPVAVSGIDPFPYKSGAGQYVVTGSDGYIVSPTFWRDQGGSVTVDSTENEGEIKVTIKGPQYDSARAPYRISEGDAGRPALYITGEGVVNTPKTIRVATGSPNAAKEVGVKVESPFINTRLIAYDIAARAARKFSGPEITGSINEALHYDTPSSLGAYPSGGLVKQDRNVMRVVSTTQNPSAVSLTTGQHNTIQHVKDSFGAGATINDVKANYAGRPISKTNLGPLKEVK